MSGRDRTAHCSSSRSPIVGGRRRQRSPLARELGYWLEALAAGLAVALVFGAFICLLALGLGR